MVPTYHSRGACNGSEVQVPEASGRAAGASGVDPGQKSHWAAIFVDCALGARGLDPSDSDPARVAHRADRAVALWALLASGVVSRQEVEHTLRTGGARGALGHAGALEVGPLALAMAELPSGQVRAELAPLWDRLRAGTLPVAELPGQRP